MGEIDLEAEAALRALAGIRHTYIVPATWASGEYWMYQLGLRRRDCTILTYGNLLQAETWLRGRKLQPGDVVYDTGEYGSSSKNVVQEWLRIIGWNGQYDRILDDR